jgi:hypothetical protein
MAALMGSKLVRAQSRCNGSAKGSSEVESHLEEFRSIHEAVISALTSIEKMWGSLRGQVSLFRSVLTEQQSKEY